MVEVVVVVELSEFIYAYIRIGKTPKVHHLHHLHHAVR